MEAKTTQRRETCIMCLILLQVCYLFWRLMLLRFLLYSRQAYLTARLGSTHEYFHWTPNK